MANIFYSRADALTLTQQIIATTDDHELAMLMNAIQNACKVVADAIRKAGIADLYGLAGVENSTGDEVKKLDLMADKVWIHCLKKCGVCCVLVSEELENALILDDTKETGEFCVAFDPLDGSSNIDCNVSVGSIFSIYRRNTPKGQAAQLSDILRPGSELVAAGYSMYGASTELVIAKKNHPVNRFSLDPAIGEFIFVQEIKIPPDGGQKIYSCNEGNSKYWDESIKQYVADCKDNKYTARYVGSMVSDVHRSLLYGGIFFYPADEKSKKGKLRVLYEGFPMAFLARHAGGDESTGFFEGKEGSILEVVPSDIHARCPIIIGCKRDVEKLRAFIKKS